MSCNKHSWGLRVGLFSVLCLVVVGLITGIAYSAPTLPASGEKQNVKLIGWSDLQGRETLQVTTKGDWVYVGHHEGSHQNPLMSNALEVNGTTILNISDPAHPVIVAHIPGDYDRDPGCEANARSASVVYGFNSRDFLIRNHECTTSALPHVYEIFDITNRANGIDGIFKVGEITGTPDPSCRGLGGPCGGELQTNGHKSYWSQSGMWYAAGDEPGFRSGAHLLVYNLSRVAWDTDGDPRTNYNATFVGRGWLPGQKNTEDPPDEGLSLHHPIVDEANDRVYAAYFSGGNYAAFDITEPVGANRQFPVAWQIDAHPPGARGHTVSVVKYELGELLNFNDTAFPRTYALMSEENVSNNCGPGFGVGYDMREKLYMADITSADLFATPPGTGVPFTVETWQVPDGNFCEKGARFGPHQFAETMNGELNLFEDKIAYVAYFNAGIRVIDISDPYNIEEVGYYIPQQTLPGPTTNQTVIQTNDVDVDYRGLVYASDRNGNGLWILEFKK